MSSPPTLSQFVAGNLRAEMARQGKTSKQLASTLNLSQSSAHRRMRGDSRLSLDELDAISAWLQVPVESLTTAPSHITKEEPAA